MFTQVGTQRELDEILVHYSSGHPVIVSGFLRLKKDGWTYQHTNPGETSKSSVLQLAGLQFLDKNRIQKFVPLPQKQSGLTNHVILHLNWRHDMEGGAFARKWKETN